MATNKKRMEQARMAREQQKKTNQIIAIVLGVIVLVVAAVVWYVNYGPKAAASTPAPISTPATDPAAGTPPNAAIPNSAKQWPSAPAMSIDKTKQYFATVKMAKGGQFVMQLFPDKAPITVNSFVFLAREGFFNGITFHRVIEGFMAQAGDPTGTGSGSPGYEFVNEDNDLKFDKAGVVAMANAGRDTNGSQFFITFDKADFLNGSYTIFGQVTEGMDVVNAITRRDPQTNPTFTGDVIATVTITEK